MLYCYMMVSSKKMEWSGIFDGYLEMVCANAINKFLMVLLTHLKQQSIRTFPLRASSILTTNTKHILLKYITKKENRTRN